MKETTSSVPSEWRKTRPGSESGADNPKLEQQYDMNGDGKTESLLYI